MERHYKCRSGCEIRILNIPEDLSDEEKEELEKKKNDIVKLLGEERANSSTARASTSNE